MTDSTPALPPVQVDITPAIVADLQHQVQALNAAYTLAKSLCKTAFAPDKYRDKPEDGAVAILYGQRLGLDAIQSLQNVFVVYGTPSTYAKVMKGRLQSKGHRIRTIESNDERAVVRGWRKGAAEDDFEESVWTIERADKAGYVKKNAKYVTEPTNMLYSRATSECCRRTAPEEILGIYDVNEMQDEERLVRVVQSERADQPSPAATIIAARTQQPEAPAEPVAEAEPVDISHLMPTEEQPAETELTERSAADPEPPQAATEPPPADRLKELGRLLRIEKLTTRKAQVEWLDTQIHTRAITAPEDLTAEEVEDLIGFLATEQARDAEQGQLGDPE